MAALDDVAAAVVVCVERGRPAAAGAAPLAVAGLVRGLQDEAAIPRRRSVACVPREE